MRDGTGQDNLHMSASSTRIKTRRTLLLCAAVDLDEHIVAVLATLAHRRATVRDLLTTHWRLQLPGHINNTKVQYEGTRRKSVSWLYGADDKTRVASVRRPVANEATWHVRMWHDMLQVQICNRAPRTRRRLDNTPNC
jgi:hypothetical protein